MNRSDQGRVRLALPNKGRLSQPAVTLLAEAGFDFESDQRRLFAPCHNYPLDLLFVRAEDISEYTQDGVVDLGITGSNLLAESGATVERWLKLGFGRCRLQLAVPEAGSLSRLDQLAGRLVATSHPRATSSFFSQNLISVRLLEISGAVEIAPLLGVADAIADLVSTGTTLATNGLRPLDTILESEAELIARQDLESDRRQPADHVRMVLTSVIAARDRKYLMMNAPRMAVPAIEALLPGMKSPSVLQLADPTMVALHAVVESAAVWALLSPLRELGASSILVLPIEKLIP
ncbi:MAG TPA: ATP phosphoribosyltransferase [Candidatus Dormibacteraeota bacterium]|nr:ATP phosphoribosyltransferase [Candidatus Dormibacteraeota bacterium]